MNILLKKNIPLIILFILFTSIVLMCAVPPVSRDALTHHLAVPALYVEKGNIHELPDIIPSYYPQLLDLIYCIPLIFNNDIAPKYIHFTFALLTALLIFLYLQQRVSHFYGLLSALFFLSLPVIVKLSVTVYVDLGLIFFSFAALLCLLKWQEKKFQLSWLILAAICCGLALSTKYNGLITFFILTAFTPIIYLKGCKNFSDNKKNRARIQLKAVGYGLGFMLIAVFVFSPWMIKNYIWTKNPVYPLYNSYFNPESKAEIELKDPTSKLAINHFHIRKFVYKESWFETATIPLRIFFQGEDDNPKFFDGRLNPLLFLLPFFAFMTVPGKKDQFHSHKKIFLWFSILYILIVFFRQDMRIRWIGPAIAPLVILSSLGLKNIFMIVKTQYMKYFFTILIICTVFMNAVYIYQLFNKIDPLSYISHQITRDEYIEKFRPEYAALQYTNQLKGDIKLLAFFLGNRMYYSEHDIKFKHNLFKNIVQNSKTPGDIYQTLKIKNFTNFIINYAQFNLWIERTFTLDEKKQIHLFFNTHTKRLFLKNGHGVYQCI
jgi:4-amino-4-deoxy-L-arabinose transferase-like glycosyltransferase